MRSSTLFLQFLYICGPKSRKTCLTPLFYYITVYCIYLLTCALLNIDAAVVHVTTTAGLSQQQHTLLYHSSNSPSGNSAMGQSGTASITEMFDACGRVAPLVLMLRTTEGDILGSFLTHPWSARFIVDEGKCAVSIGLIFTHMFDTDYVVFMFFFFAFSPLIWHVTFDSIDRSINARHYSLAHRKQTHTNLHSR